MAKDPAFLFYPNDWSGGTTAMTRFLKGCYMDLLVAQFNLGPLSLEEIKTVLAADFGQAWPSLQKKFKQADGAFFNERLEAEKIKRATYSESRRNNRKGTHDRTHVKDMNHDKENENENRDPVLGFGKSENLLQWNTFPGAMELMMVLPDLQKGMATEFWVITKSQQITDAQILGLWKVFKGQNFTGKKFYENIEATYSHFINWLKSQKLENGTVGKVTERVHSKVGNKKDAGASALYRDLEATGIVGS